MNLPNGIRLGPYKIVGEVGAGGMAEVYCARDDRLQRNVAIKVLADRFALDHDALARFQRESTAVAALSHPNIRGIYDIGTEKGRTYAVMELLEGETLSTRLESSSLTWQESVEIALAVAEGMSAAHDKGIIHRDIKPKNIFLTADGGVKILDFGLAHLEAHGTSADAIDSAAISSLATQPGAILGTASYMSPEQVRGRSIDARSDIFSIGTMLYEMVTRSRAFNHETPVETMTAILQHDPIIFADLRLNVPTELQRIVSHCLEKEPSKRFQTARDLIFALSGLVEDIHMVARGPSLIPDSNPTLNNTSRVELLTNAEPSVAVLPFVNMSSDRENEYFSDGLADELINALCKIDGLNVASRTSAFAFKGKSQDIRRIGERLNVRSVLEGSVRKFENRLRITAQLVSVEDGYHLWSETFDREVEDVFAIQNEIAQSIAGALEVVISDREKRALTHVPTVSIQAYEHFLRGRQFFYQFRRTAIEEALRLFKQACELDPEFAAAHAGIAGCCAMLHSYWGACESHRKEADEASLKALDLAPDQSEVHVARAMALALDKRYDEAYDAFETAVRLNPDSYDAYYFFGRTCYEHGRLDQAVQLFEKASRVNPEDYQAETLAATVYAGMGRKQDSYAASRRALSAIRRHLQLYPQDGRALYMGAITHIHMGDSQRGLE